MSTATRETPYETRVGGHDLTIRRFNHPLETWVRSLLGRRDGVVDATVYPSSVYLTFDGPFGTLNPPEGYAIRKVSYNDDLIHVRVDTAEHAGRMTN